MLTQLSLGSGAPAINFNINVFIRNVFLLARGYGVTHGFYFHVRRIVLHILVLFEPHTPLRCICGHSITKITSSPLITIMGSVTVTAVIVVTLFFHAIPIVLQTNASPAPAVSKGFSAELNGVKCVNKVSSLT